MYLYFVNRFNKYKLLAEIPDAEHAYPHIKAFLDKYNYKSYYTRSWGNEEKTWFDVGSHSEFFIARKVAYRGTDND